MRSLLGRFHRPMSRGLVNNMLTMNNLGDGSTLSLDFTTMGGVLDPRLTFSRASTATFVNSQGYVEYAGANLISNSGFSGTSGLAPTSWSASANYDGSIPSVGVRTVTTGATAQQKFVANTITVSPGITYSVGVYVSEVSGQHYANTLTLTGTAVVSQMYRDGVPVGMYTTAFPGLITAVFTISSGTTTDIRIGIGSTGSSVSNGSCTFSLPRCVPGNFPQPVYIASPTTAAYHAPRFDYSPTNIGEPRGLLVEGQAANSALYSQNINPNSSPQNIYWVVAGAGASVTPVSQTDPANESTASRCILGTSTVGRVYQAFSTTSGATYTMSFWAKSVSGNTALHFWHYNSATSNYTAVTVGTSWSRYQVTILARSGGGFVEFGIANLTATAATIDLWGMQIELGSGASSYIPTGASGVTRNADSCVMTGTNFSSWFAGATEGVLFAEYEKPRSQSGNAAHDYSAVASKYNTGEGLIVYAGNSNFYPTNILWPTGGAIFAGGIATAIPSVTKQAAKWFAANDLTMYSNGVVGSTAAGTGTVTLAMLSFGANSNTGTEATRDWLNACVRRVKFYPTALSDAAIQTLTTP